MSIEQLINSLKEKQRSKTEELWREAKAEATGAQKRCSEKILNLQRDHERRIEQAVRQQAESLLTDTRRRCRKECLEAEERTVNRLKNLAVCLLPSLRDDTYPDLFSRLTAEIPARRWHHVIVNPEDVDLAAELFPEAEIQTDRGIQGGLIVENKNREIAVCNTLEKRLEKSWPQLMPLLLKELHSKYVPDQQ